MATQPGRPWTAPELRVWPADESAPALNHARKLAAHLGAPLIETGMARERWGICTAADGLLSLQRPDGVTHSVSFASGRARRQAGEPDLARQPLARALGLVGFKRRHGRYPVVLDGCAGFGTDAWLMASLGCPVRCLEQHPVVHALLADAVRRAQEIPALAACAALIQVHHGDAVAWLRAGPALTWRPSGLEQNALTAGEAALGNVDVRRPFSEVIDVRTAIDVVYLDPMYPEHGRRAQVRKPMQFLQALLGPPDDPGALIEAALSSGVRRVVIKRPPAAPAMEVARPGLQSIHQRHAGTRYDIHWRTEFADST